jgi:hypothetical protein
MFTIQQQINEEWVDWGQFADYHKCIVVMGLARKYGRTVRLLNSQGEVVA